MFGNALKFYGNDDEEGTYKGFLFCFVFCFFVFCHFRVTPAAYGGSQARGLIGAIVAGLCQSHSNAGPELGLPPTPQFMATLDP